MKRSIQFILATIIALTSVSCDKNISIGIGEEITIPFDKTATLYQNGLEFTVKFTQLIEESRCPPDMVCFWEGRAVVEIEVNSDKTFELESSTSSNPAIVKSANYQDYQIELISAFADSDDDFGIEKKYSIIVVVTD